MSGRWLALWALFAWLGPAPVWAQVATANLSVAPGTTVSVTLDAIVKDTEVIGVTGNLVVEAETADHPSFGRVVTSLRFVGGALAHANANFDLTLPDFVSITASTTNLSVMPGGVVLDATPVANGQSVIDLDGLEMHLVAGLFTAGGNALGDSVLGSANFGVTPRLIDYQGGQATVDLTVLTGGAQEIDLTLSPDFQILGIPSPIYVPLYYAGTISASGPLPLPVPASPAGRWPWLLLALALGAAGILARPGRSTP